jgi:hypothetical protein
MENIRFASIHLMVVKVSEISVSEEENTNIRYNIKEFRDLHNSRIHYLWMLL